MSTEKLASKYISSAEEVLRRLEVADAPVTLDFQCVKKVLSMVRDYLEDARYYREKKKFEVSLTSVAYCEGLLDGARMLGALKFEWPLRETVKKPKER